MSRICDPPKKNQKACICFAVLKGLFGSTKGGAPLGKLSESVFFIFGAIYNNLIFTFSNEGYFFVIDKNNGNIIRITDVFNVFENNKRKKINPIGFIAGTKKIVLSLNNGRLLIIDILTGKTEKISKIDNEKISRPFIFDKKIMLVKNDSIIRLN